MTEERDWRLSRGIKPEQCKGCPRFAIGKGFVPTDGPRDANVLGIGRNPGPIEALTGRAYSGGAGKLLDNLLVRAGLSRPKIALTNLVKCGGPEPTIGEIAYCTTQYLGDEIAPLKQKLASGESACIIAIGGPSAKFLCNIDKVKHERGTVHSFLGVPVVITLEPAGLLWSKSEAKNIGETRDYLPIVIKDLVKVKRIAGGQAKVSATRELFPHATEANCEDMLDRIEKIPSFGLDVETNYDPRVPGMDGKTITMIGLSDKPGRAVTFMPWAMQKYKERLQRIFADPAKTLVGWNNAQFDAWRMRDNGWTVNNRQGDMMLADHLIESDMGDFTLEGGASRHLDYEPWKHLSTKDPMRNCLDVSITLELDEVFMPRLKELGSLDLFWNHQVPMADLCQQATRAGIRVDEESMAKAALACDLIMKRYESELTRLLGPLFNWRSPKQLLELLYGTFQMPVQKHRRTKKPTTDHYAMDDLVKIATEPGSTFARIAPILKAVVELKRFDKIVGTYLSGEDIHPDGRFHPSFLQHRQVTGRISAQGPNVMQLPQGPAREMILPDTDDDVIIKIDFSQIQLRLCGWYSNDKNLNERLLHYDENPKDEWGDKQDVHRLHANRFYGDTRLDRTKRSLSKNMFYGIQFGQGADGLATMYGVEKDYAQKFIDFIWSEYPQLKRWRNGILNTIDERNYLRTPYGRVRWLWNRNFATEAFIALPQMGELDMVVESALKLSKVLPSSVRQLMWVHDEIDLNCPRNIAEEIAKLAEDVCSEPREKLDGFRCPAKAQIGNNYNEASEEAGLAGDWRRLRRTVR